MVRREEFFTLEELKRAGGRLKARTALGFDGVPNEILKEVIGAYPEILLEAFNSCVREGRFFANWKKQRLVLLRKGNKTLGDLSSYRPICLLDTMGKLLEELILQMQERELVSVRDSARWSALTYVMRSIPRDGTSESRRWCGKRFQTTCCE